MIMISTSTVPKEIETLAEHQLEILRRRFPIFEHILYDYGWPDNYWMVVMMVGITILQISFHSNSIEIVSYDEEEEIKWTNPLILNYADPRFTDDTIPDMLKEWEAHPAAN